MKRDALFFSALCLMFLLTASGCGGGGGNSEAPGPGNLQASATIGANGGTIVVANPDSPVYGTKIVIPPGALNEDTLIAVSLPPADPAVPLPGSLMNTIEDRTFHEENLLTNYTTTTQDHGISSLDEDYWHQYLDSGQITGIAEPFRIEIENILKGYISP